MLVGATPPGDVATGVGVVTTGGVGAGALISHAAVLFEVSMSAGDPWSVTSTEVVGAVTTTSVAKLTDSFGFTVSCTGTVART